MPENRPASVRRKIAVKAIYTVYKSGGVVGPGKDLALRQQRLANANLIEPVKR
jgi:hypothetical protein